MNQSVGDITDPIVEQARARFRRVLSGWVMDVLALRRSGLDRPSVRYGVGPQMGPGSRLTERSVSGRRSGAIRRF